MFRIRSTIGLSTLLEAILFALLWQSSQVQGQRGFDLDGKSIDPIEASPGKVVVLIFMRRDCPISSRYAPVIQKISSENARDVRFWLVFPDKTETPLEINKYLQDYGYRLPALRDPEHVLVKLVHVEITPEAAVFDRDRHLVYHGRIDDWYVEFGKPRAAPTTHELKDAIATALSGKEAAPSAVKGVGCYISDLE
jgi:thiol-disulfide isomerase/thioredoxin